MKYKDKTYNYLFSHRRFKPKQRLLNPVISLLFVIFLTVCLVPLINFSMRFLVKTIAKEQHDHPKTIVILGRGPNSRAERALKASQLWYREQEINIFVSGMTDAPLIISTLKEMGVPSSNLGGEKCSQSTWENALFSDLILSEEKKNIILITDSAHIVRSLLFFQQFGFKVTPYIVESKKSTIFSLRNAQLTLREYFALIYYLLQGRFNVEPADKNWKEKSNAIRKVELWECRL